MSKRGMYLPALLLVLAAVGPAWALDPDEVAVVVNANVPGSHALALDYCKAREIPPQNLVALHTASTFAVTRTDYQEQILTPLREALIARKLRTKIRCIVLIYGMPVHVLGPGQELTSEGTAPPPAKDDPLADATVDSELTLIWVADYETARFLPNPGYWKTPRNRQQAADLLVLTSRIDGPSLADAARLIKNSISAEKGGLDGRLYIEAGGPVPSYDQRLRKLAGFVSRNSKLPVVLGANPASMHRGVLQEAALYVGWRAPGKYVSRLQWVPGAVGWHVGSTEASELRDPSSRQWVPRMLQEGVAATMGAVADPYLGAFPSPDEFFPLLLTGEWTVAECYWRTQPMISWRMTLIADPLYNPYRKWPKMQRGILPGGISP